jgi:hypothetical protein
MRPRAQPGIALVLICLCLAAAFPEPGARLPSLLDIPSGTRLESLLRRPRKVFLSVRSLSKQEGGGIQADSDYHIVYPLEARDLWRVLTDFSLIREINPSVIEVSVDQSNWPPEFVENQLFGFSFMGIKVKYRVKVRCIYEQTGPGEYRGSWSLIENPEGHIVDLGGSFLIRDIELDGEPHCYMRWSQSLGMRKSYLGVRTLLEALTPMEMSAFLNRCGKTALSRR